MKKSLLFIFLSFYLGSFTKAIAQAPTITSFTPISAKPGDVVTITGTGFNTSPTNNVVFFGATRANVTASNAITLTATVPSGATYAPITLLNAGSNLSAYSLTNFNPIYAPAKTGITATDFEAKLDLTPGYGTASVAIGDLDGDGKPDIVVANNGSNNISVYRNTSVSGSFTSGSFADKVDFTTGPNPISVAIGDLDSDGKPDLAVANFNSTSVSIYRNTGTSGSLTMGSFAAKVDFTTGNQPISVTIGDLDVDGKPDLAVANYNSNTISVYRNTGTSSSITTGSFAAKVDFTTAGPPNAVAISDLDGNGKPDLVTANQNSNSVSVLRNTSTSGYVVSGSFAAKVDFTTGFDCNSVAIGDLDGDSKPDVMAANLGSNNISLLRNADIVAQPVTLVSYDAKLNINGAVQLNWSTVSEANNSYFELLRSTNGVSFSSISKITGAGNSAQKQQYNFIDQSPIAGTNYYQLLQFDNDGKKTDLGIRAVNVSLNNSHELSMYPNPTTGIVNLSFEGAIYQKLELVDLAGKTLLTKLIRQQENQISIDISQLLPGIYTISLKGERRIVRNKIIKK